MPRAGETAHVKFKETQQKGETAIKVLFCPKLKLGLGWGAAAERRDRRSAHPTHQVTTSNYSLPRWERWASMLHAFEEPIHYFSLTERSADTNPSFLGRKMIKRNLNTINVSTRWTAFTYEQFSTEYFPQIYVIYIFCWFKDYQSQDLSSVYICLCKRRINSFSFKEKYSNWPQVNKQLLTEVSLAMFILNNVWRSCNKYKQNSLYSLYSVTVCRKWSNTTLIYTKTSFIRFLKNRLLCSNITMNMLEETWTYYKYLNLYNSKH